MPTIDDWLLERKRYVQPVTRLRHKIKDEIVATCYKTPTHKHKPLIEVMRPNE